MNILTSCNYLNCYQQFKNVYDLISHYETKHLPENDWKRVQDIDQLERNLENSVDAREKERIQDHLNNLYNQPLRMSLFFKLDPYPPNHIVNPQEKKPLTLQFTNYRKRPAPNQPIISVTPKKSSKNMNGDVAASEHGSDERKYHCKIEGCTKAYKNSAGLRSHMRSVHNSSAQQAPSISPSPNYASNAHISYQPSNQSYYAQRPEDTKPIEQTGHPQAGSIGALATFNSTTSRLHGSDEGFTQPPSNANVNYRAGSRLTPSEENILNRNLTTLSAAPPRSTTPVSQSGQRVQDGKFKCDYCPKTYKTNSNLQKHIKDNHRQQQQQAADAAANSQRPVLSKNVLRTYSIGSNQGGPNTPQPTQQQQQVSSVQQAKNTLLTAKNVQPSARSPASPSLMSNSPNLSPAPHMSAQSPIPQRQITVNNQSNVQQRTYVQTRTTYAPVQTQSQAQQQPIYHLQQIQQQPTSNDTPQSLDIQIPQNQNASSPRNYSSSPVTVVLQSQQQPSPNVQNDHYQPTGPTPTVRMPASRNYNSQQYYEKYQNTVQQRRPATKTYSNATGSYNYQPKQIKQVYRQPTNSEYARGSMNRVNTVSSTGQPVRISSLNTQSGAPISSIMNAGQNMMNSGNPSNTMPTAYQVRTNFDSMRRSPQVQSNSLSSQLTPLNLNYGGNTTTTTTSIDGIQITKVTPSQYGNPRIRATSSGAIRGRLNDNIRGGHSGLYNQAMPPRYGQGAQQYTTQRSIMRVIQTQPTSNNPNVMQQERPVSHQQQQSHNTSDN